MGARPHGGQHGGDYPHCGLGRQGARVGRGPPARLGQHDRHLVAGRPRIVRADVAAQAVRERLDYAPRVGIVDGVCRGDEHSARLERHRKGARREHALLQHGEEGHLLLWVHDGQLVDAQQPVLGLHELPRRVRLDAVRLGAAPGHPCHVDVPDQVLYRQVGRCQHVSEPGSAGPPLHPGLEAAVPDRIQAVGADVECGPLRHGLAPLQGRGKLVRRQVQRAVASGAAAHDRHLREQRLGDRPGKHRLCLPDLADEQHVVACQQGPVDRRLDRSAEPDYARVRGEPCRPAGRKVAADLGARRHHPVARLEQVA